MAHERKRHWEAIYREKGPTEVSWHQDHPAMSLALISDTGLAHDAPLIDVGGGASRLVDHLLDAGYRDITVLDIASEALSHARARLGARARTVHWVEADVTAFTPPHPYELWHDRAVFHFLTDADDRRRYIEALRRGLTTDGHLIIATFGLDGPEKCSGLPVERYDARRLSAELGDRFRLEDVRDELHATPAGKTQAFTCFRLRRQAE